MSKDPHEQVYNSFFLSVLLCCLIVPGWVLYMLPMAMKAEGILTDDDLAVHGTTSTGLAFGHTMSRKAKKQATRELHDPESDNEEQASKAAGGDDFGAGSSSAPYRRSISALEQPEGQQQLSPRSQLLQSSSAAASSSEPSNQQIERPYM